MLCITLQNKTPTQAVPCSCYMDGANRPFDEGFDTVDQFLYPLSTMKILSVKSTTVSTVYG